MCWPSCGNDSRILRITKESWCVGLARSRWWIRFTGAVEHIPLPRMGPRCETTQHRPHQAQVPAQLARALVRPPPRLNPTEHDTEACIQACVTNILATRLLVGGLACCFAPAAQPSRVPYGCGGIIGKSFEYRSGHWAQVYLVAPPALEFATPSNGSHEPLSESQLRAYYRSIPDMQHPTPVYGSIPLHRCWWALANLARWCGRVYVHHRK